MCPPPSPATLPCCRSSSTRHPKPLPPQQPGRRRRRSLVFPPASCLTRPSFATARTCKTVVRSPRRATSTVTTTGFMWRVPPPVSTRSVTRSVLAATSSGFASWESSVTTVRTHSRPRPAATPFWHEPNTIARHNNIFGWGRTVPTANPLIRDGMKATQSRRPAGSRSPNDLDPGAGDAYFLPERDESTR